MEGLWSNSSNSSSSSYHRKREEECFNVDHDCLRRLEHYYSREYCTRYEDIQTFVRTIITLYNYYNNKTTKHHYSNKKTSSLSSQFAPVSLHNESQNASKRSVQLAIARAYQDEVDAKHVYNQQQKPTKNKNNDNQLISSSSTMAFIVNQLWSIMFMNSHNHYHTTTDNYDKNDDDDDGIIDDECPEYYYLYCTFSTILITLIFISVIAFQRLTIKIFF